MNDEAIKSDAGGEGETRPAGPEAGDAKIRFTSKIRRGLALVRVITLFSLDESKPPSRTVMKDWTKKQVDESNAALAWLEQEETWDAKTQALWETHR